MARRPKKPAGGPLLFAEGRKRRHLRLFLPKFLEFEADKPAHLGPDADRARRILLDWADLAEQGHLNQKETTLDADFLEKVFGDALGYRSVSESPEEFHRHRQYAVPGGGTADGALGHFTSSGGSPVAIIELKGAQTDLDHDRFNGRTPVQQCGDYLRELPDCPWGIVSNYVTIRLYHRDRTSRAYEEFGVQELRDEKRWRQFYYIFARPGLLRSKLQESRALDLLKRTETRQKEVGDDLYEGYSDHRIKLIHHLVREKQFTEDQAIHIAQKILDRIIFIAFCEDRGLLPDRMICRAYSEIPPVSRVVNPRWQNFKELFAAVDEGNNRAGIPGYDGGLFRNDPVVDNLELDDDWTHFFSSVSKYDFRDEVNVDVLGHLFERSVTELEKLRAVGLFGAMVENGSPPAMPKSALRKRFGIYYTPADFTRLMVENTIGRLIEDRVDTIEDAAGRIEELRRIKVCDPACGSGAFLIAAYDRLEDAYDEAARMLRIEGESEQAKEVEAQAPDWILGENLYGVDVSEESIEITQLALWLRSARRGRPLSDLSGNIKCGNSLVRDPAIHPRAMDWRATFPAVFDRQQGGFDVVIGNPPWERMKLQEREFFSLTAPDIASAVNAADRRRLIAGLETGKPGLWDHYQQSQDAAEKTLAHARESGEFPLTGRGDINTYMLFAELARTIVSAQGRVGLLVPSGIATDSTTRYFFRDLIDTRTLVALYDFENKRGLFPDVHRSFKFSVLLMGGSAVEVDHADFVFFAREVNDLKDKRRHIALSAKDLRLVNPNTRTCPIFRSRQDAELTKGVYRRVPVLIDRNRKAGGNPWAIRFLRMFDQTNDAELFRTAAQLQEEGFRRDGNRWVRRKEVYLPLYEAKMIQAFDHRAASVRIEQDNWMRQGQPEKTTLVEHQNPEFAALPRYWVAESEVVRVVGTRFPQGFIGFKDITNSTNQRTMIAAAIPWSAVTNHFPIMIPETDARLRACLLANLNSLAFDYVTRQKVGAITLNFFIVEQLPTLPPEQYGEVCPWRARQTLESWISERVLKLTCTANDMAGLAEAAEFSPGVHRWNENERAQLRAELDAAYLRLYGFDREDVEYILSTFQGIVAEDRRENGEGATRALVLEAFDQIAHPRKHK